MNGKRLHQWLWNNQSQLCLRESIKCWRLGECLGQKPYKLVLFLLLQKSTVGNCQGKDAGLDGPLVQINTCILFSCRELEPKPHCPQHQPFQPPSALFEQVWVEKLHKYLLHSPSLTWSSALCSHRKHCKVPYVQILKISQHGFQLVLLISVWSPWHFGLHIMESWNGLGQEEP